MRSDELHNLSSNNVWSIHIVISGDLNVKGRCSDLWAEIEIEDFYSI